MEQESEKVTYSCGRKISDNQYGSTEFFCSYSTTLLDGETPETGFSRARKEVEGYLGKRLAEMRAKTEAAAKVRRESFQEGQKELDEFIDRKRTTS